MGGLAPFFSRFAQRAEEKAKEKRDEFNKDKDAHIAIYTRTLQDPTATGEQRTKAAAELDKLYSLKGKDQSPFQTVAGFLNRLGEHAAKKAQGGQGGQSQDQSAQPQAGGSARDNPMELPPLEGGAAKPAAAQSAQPKSGVGPATSKIATDALKKVSHGLGEVMSAPGKVFAPNQPGLPRLDAEAVSTGNQNGKKILQWHDAETGQEIARMQRADGTLYDISSDGKVMENVSKFPRKIAETSVEDARKLTTSGQRTFTDENGKPLDLTKLPDDMGIVTAVVGGKMISIPFTPDQTTVKFDNEVVAVGKYQKKEAREQGTVLGQAQVPKTTTSEVPGVVNGQPVMQKKYSTITPMTPGAAVKSLPGNPKAVRVPTEPTEAPSSRTVKSSPAGTPISSTPSGSVTTKPDGNVQVLPKGMRPAAFTPAEYNFQIKRATPIAAAAVQIFGNPADPEFKGLMSYADLADDPAARERINNAWQLMVKDLAAVDMKSGGIMGAMKNYLDFPTFVGSSIQSATEDVLNDLQTNHPRESDALNASIAGYGSIIGYRSITGGSAAQFSATSIEREMPVIGANVTSSQAFYDKIIRLGEETQRGATGLAPEILAQQGITREQIASNLNRVRQLARQKPVKALPGNPGATADTSKKPSGSSRTPVELDKEIMDAAESLRTGTADAKDKK